MSYRPDDPRVVARLRSLRDAPPPTDPTPEPRWCRVLRPGLRVTHPQYGPGVILEETFAPTGRKGLIRFDSGQECWFILIKSPIRIDPWD
jgi:hypothetical protein